MGWMLNAKDTHHFLRPCLLMRLVSFKLCTALGSVLMTKVIIYHEKNRRVCVRSWGIIWNTSYPIISDKTTHSANPFFQDSHNLTKEMFEIPSRGAQNFQGFALGFSLKVLKRLYHEKHRENEDARYRCNYSNFSIQAGEKWIPLF